MSAPESASAQPNRSATATWAANTNAKAANTNAKPAASGNASANTEANPRDKNQAQRDSLRLHHHLSPRRERALFASLGFLVAVVITRTITVSLHYRSTDSSGGIVIGGVHVHHLVFGILLLLGVGYAWLLHCGDSGTSRRWASRVTAALYGVSAALILDEYALWLNLRDVYWERQGREDVAALACFGGLLAAALLAAPFLRAAWKVVRHGSSGARRS